MSCVLPHHITFGVAEWTAMVAAPDQRPCTDTLLLQGFIELLSQMCWNVWALNNITDVRVECFSKQPRVIDREICRLWEPFSELTVSVGLLGICGDALRMRSDEVLQILN